MWKVGIFSVHYKKKYIHSYNMPYEMRVIRESEITMHRYTVMSNNSVLFFRSKQKEKQSNRQENTKETRHTCGT